MPKSDFNKVALQLYRNRTSAWMFSCKFATYFQNTLPKKSSEGLVLIWFMTNFENSWYPDKIFCHQVTKTKCALNLNLFIENAFKRCLTQYVWMKHQLDPRYVWDKNMKKNLLFTEFLIFFENILLDMFMHSQWHNFLIPCFVKKSKVYVKDAFR